MDYKGDIVPGQVLRFSFTTVDSAGVPATLSGTPTLSVYKDGSTTQSTSGITLTADFDGITGLNHVAIDTSADGTFYAAGSDFMVIVSAGTVGGDSVVGYGAAEFSIANRSALRPTIAGRTADISSGGAIGIDWSNVEAPTTTLNLSGTTIKTATDVETDTADIQSRLPAALVSGRMDVSVGAYQSGLTPLQPTTAGRTLDVSAAGNAGIDWSNVENPTTTVGLTGTTIATSQVVASVTGNVGGNVTGSVGSLGTQAKLDVNAEADTALSDAGVTTTRTGYLDKLNISGNVAASSEVTAIQNNTKVVRVVPELVERPDSGTTTYRIELMLYDETGNMEAPDSAPTIALVNQSGNDRSSRLDSTTMALVSTGYYRAIYTASSGDAIEQLVWTFSVVEGGATRVYGNATLVVDTTAVDFTSADRTKLDTLHDTRLTAQRAANLDNLDAAVSAIETDTQDIQSRLPAALSSGRIVSYVESMATDVITSAALSAGAVTEIQSGLAVQTTIDNSFGAVISDTEDIQGRLPAALVSGRMSSQVGAMGADVLTASALASDAVSEIQSGLATSSALASSFALVLADTDDIQTRLPATLSSGLMRSSVESMATDSLTSAAVSAAAVTKIQSGLAQASTVAGSFGAVISDTEDIQSRLPATLSSGRMVSSAEAISTDAISAAAVSSAAVTKIQNGLATASSLSSGFVSVLTDTDTIKTRLPSSLVSGRLDVSVGAYQSGLTPLQPAVSGRQLNVDADGNVTAEATVDTDAVAEAVLTLADGVEPDLSLRNFCRLAGAVLFGRMIQDEIDGVSYTVYFGFGANAAVGRVAGVVNEEAETRDELDYNVDNA